jgi:hypothetical protein
MEFFETGVTRFASGEKLAHLGRILPVAAKRESR